MGWRCTSGAHLLDRWDQLSWSWSYSLKQRRREWKNLILWENKSSSTSDVCCFNGCICYLYSLTSYWCFFVVILCLLYFVTTFLTSNGFLRLQEVSSEAVCWGQHAFSWSPTVKEWTLTLCQSSRGVCHRCNQREKVWTDLKINTC